MNDKMAEAVVENMRFTLTEMGSLKTSRFRPLGEGGFLLATGTDAASENWAFLPSEGATKEKVAEARSFFDELNLPFVWPLFPGARRAFSEDLLAQEGLPPRGELMAMICVKPILKNFKKTSLIFQEAATPEKASVWAETAWRGFGSSSGAPDAFVNLARGLCEKTGFFLLLARREGVPVGTAMLVSREKRAGIYYFATPPEERRKGVGSAMMNEIFQRFDVVTLQATPSGVPLYAAHGFEPLFKIPLHSSSPDVF